MNLNEDYNPKIIRAWTFYDWANSVFPLVITSAIFPNFYDAVTSTKGKNGEIISHTITFFGKEFENQNIYTFIYAFALSIVVVVTPILTGIADYLGNKKRFLQFFCYLGALSSMCLFYFSKNNLELSFVPFVTATIGFWGSLVYYNSYLPEITSVKNQDRVSAQGFAMGYFGSSLLLIICLVCILVFHMPAKFSFLFVGLWWIIFAQYTFKHLPNNKNNLTTIDSKGLILKGFSELKKVYLQIKTMPVLKRFLSGYFFYNMGVQTIMVVAVLFARNEIEWADENTKTTSLIVSILIIQFVGVAGSLIFSKLSTFIGNIKSLIIAIFIWIFICVFTFFVVHLPLHFYIVAFLVGLVMGGVQSLSRSTYSKFLPKTKDHASFFSFYDVIEKLGMIIGSITFGSLSEVFGGMRPSILSLIIYFIFGFVILFSMRRERC